jgi:hypothetical protein
MLSKSPKTDMVQHAESDTPKTESMEKVASVQATVRDIHMEPDNR